jgi:hypothetical protein
VGDCRALWVVSIYFYADVAGSYLFHSTCFVIPDGCIVLIQFYFDVLVFVCLLCFFSDAECTADSHSPECVVPDTALIQFDPPDDEHLLLETCRGIK